MGEQPVAVRYRNYKHEKPMKTNTEKHSVRDKPAGIKSSNLRSEIEMKVKKNLKVFTDAYGEEQAKAIVQSLTDAYLADQDNSKVISTANRAYLERIPSNASEQVGHHLNLKIYGSLRNATLPASGESEGNESGL